MPLVGEPIHQVRLINIHIPVLDDPLEVLNAYGILHTLKKMMKMIDLRANIRHFSGKASRKSDCFCPRAFCDGTSANTVGGVLPAERAMQHRPRGGAEAEDADADARPDALQIDIQGTSVCHHAPPGRRGMKEMQLAILPPEGYALMAIVEAGQRGDDADDVAIADGG